MKIKLILLLLSIAHLSICQQNQGKPNIILIEVDDLTAKFLHAFGAKNKLTPNIDKLAKEGVLFKNAMCQGTMCGPSRNSIITGLYPHNLAFYLNGQLPSLTKDVWTFPKELKNNGYYNYWIGKNHLRPYIDHSKKGKNKKDEAMKIQMGFDFVYQSSGRAVALKGTENKETWKYGNDVYADYLFDKGLLNKFIEEGGKQPTSLDGDTEYMDGHFTTKALEALSSHDDVKPFFMWVNYSCPHGPFDAPQIYHDMVKDSDIPQVINGRSDDIPNGLMPHLFKGNDKEILKDRKAYLASIAYIDKQIGRILSYINESKYSHNTMVVFFSDQGIMIGDHGLDHKGTLFEEILNSALIVHYPSSFKNQEIATPVELLDLGKTILDMTGGDFSKSPNGNSLLPLILGKNKFTGDGIAYSEIENHISVVDSKYKFIQTPTKPLLFDRDDISELNNIALQHPDLVTYYENKIKYWISKSGDILPPMKSNKATSQED